jgi:EAL domain-containing protein (putative c-di-GMP-specific phosphodiesterase class I)
MKHADLALYQAKANGRATYAFYRPELGKNVERRSAMTSALRVAMTRDQVQVAMQPVVSFTNGRHTGFEALVRWQRGQVQVPADEMISVAEEAGLIVDLGCHIADKALAHMRRMVDSGGDPGRVSINVAAGQLREPGFVQRFRSMIAAHRLAPRDVEIEITENVVLDRSIDAIVGTLRELSAAGIGIALDDFGTGYASLSHLKRFPIGRLKIDRSFTAGVTHRSDDAVIARTIISLAHSFGLEVVAEGVETEEQYQFLSNHGCDYAQGYLIQRPLMGTDIFEYMAAQGEFFII